MSPTSDQPAIDALAARITKKDKPSSNDSSRPATGPSPDLSDGEIIELCRRAENSAKFTALYDQGDVHTYHGGDDSVADLALLGILKFYTQDFVQLERLFSGSALGRRKKWTNRPDYRRGTIERSLSDLGETYTRLTLGTLTLGKEKGGKGEKEESMGPGSNPLLEGLVNLAEVLESGIDPPEELEPGILLKGRVHHIFAPASVGKTFLALWLAKQCLERGQKVLYLDTENGARILSERLALMKVPTQEIRANFSYLPFPGLDITQKSLQDYVELIEGVEPGLVIFDSWIKFLSSAGLAEDSNDDVARWATFFLQPLRQVGITSLVLDHVPHEGQRSRGASRKRDEVDVQYKMVKNQHFDRSTVGQVSLHLEKDREGWLPQTTTFSVGCGEGGFVFSPSKGLFEDHGAVVVLGASEEKVLEVLREEFGVAGARHSEWLKACLSKVSKPTFDRARRGLIQSHQVHTRRPDGDTKYYPGPEPGGIKGCDTELSPYLSQTEGWYHEVSNRYHDTDQDHEVSQVSHPYRGDTVIPGGETDEMKARVQTALEHGNAPKKALDHYRNGDQDIDSVVKSVMVYFGRGKDDMERWREPVLEALSDYGRWF